MGRAPLFQQLNEGDEAPALTHEPVTMTDIVKYAGASGDFTPIHYDYEVAKRAGLDKMFAMGGMSAGYLGHMVTDWLGDGTLKKFSYKFTDRVWVGDRLICRGTVVRKYANGDENRVDCDVWVENQRGEKVIVGKATAALPYALR